MRVYVSILGIHLERVEVTNRRFSLPRQYRVTSDVFLLSNKLEINVNKSYTNPFDICER